MAAANRENTGRSHGLDHLATGRRHNPADLGKRCALGGTRTPNLLIRSQMLCPLSYERRSPTSLARPHPGIPVRAAAKPGDPARRNRAASRRWRRLRDLNPGWGLPKPH
jgi:hypothetical protein